MLRVRMADHRKVRDLVRSKARGRLDNRLYRPDRAGNGTTLRRSATHGVSARKASEAELMQ